MNIENLPDSVLLIIFQQFTEAKQLMNLYLVSKTFASIVAQVSEVDIILNDRVSDGGSKLFHDMIKTSRLDRSSTLHNQASLSPYEATRFLPKFKELKTLHVEVPSIIHDLDKVTFLRWEASFLEDSAYFITFKAKSVRAENEARPEGSLTLTPNEFRVYGLFVVQCIKDALWRHHIISHITKDNHDALKDIVCSDSMRQGEVFLKKGSMTDQTAQEHETFEMRNIPVELNMKLNTTIFYKPELKLPKSKRVFDGVTIVIARLFNAMSNENIITNSFVEDSVLKEAMDEICREGIRGNVDDFSVSFLWEIIT